MKILFAGDFSVQDRAVVLFNNTENAISAFKEIQDLCKTHDLAIVNFESPVTDCTEGILKDGPCIRNPKNSIDVLGQVGFGLFCLANNHLKDYGSKGIEDTIVAMNANNVKYVGAGRNINEARNPFIFEKNGKKVGILNICENESSIASATEAGACPVSEVDLFYDISKLRKCVDYIVVIVHGGREHYQLPTPRMKKLYHYIIDLGADLVVNHHQHCYSGYETYNGKHIFYGLGNFFFDNPRKRNCLWNQGLLLSVDFGECINFEIIPFSQCNQKIGINLKSLSDHSEKIEKLNKIIVDDVKLQEAYDSMMAKAYPMSPMQPYTSHYIRALYHRGLLPDLISKQKKVEILNIVRCETHRELLISYIENCLSKK